MFFATNALVKRICLGKIELSFTGCISYTKCKMEGACGTIVPSDNPLVVIKRVHKRPGPHRRTKSHRAPAQCSIQSWAHTLCKPSNGYSILYVPRAWDPEMHQYKMDLINTETLLVNEGIPVAELQKFYRDAKLEGIFPCDYELYQQPDGRVAMVDFDKFGRWLTDGTVLFPWGQILSRPLNRFGED